ncbi:hypothetical protein GR160_14150 [Flavobacterium sp. Sd200]|uniref:GIN domain-containing protein n=1 Tax=Flavobacterium sp. Sd200 TaxID=2692211 RepID=UPI00136F51A7|nr:DUF2807 domain-containing protein [Flavobacterium sp. Sd200]MXN92367.1 hypothetical protein [Flavobacterium sp. Sd200]
MKQFFIAAFAGLISLGAQAQITEARTAQAVTAIEVKNGIEVVFTQSDTLGLKVTTDKTVNLANIVTTYKNGTLKITLRDNDDQAITQTVAKVFVSQKNVTHFTASTGAAIRVAGKLNLTEADINLSSGATFSAILSTTGRCSIEAQSGGGFRGIINSKDFHAKIVNGGYIRTGGSTDTAKITCSSGSLNAGKFICHEATIQAQKASSVSIYANSSIKTEVDASSSVTYYGEPIKTDFGSNAYAVKRDSYKLNLN